MLTRMERLCISVFVGGSLLFATLCLLLLQGNVWGYSMEKQIVNSAPSADMFDLFRVMPEGEVNVMTEFDLLLTLDQYRQLYWSPSRPRSRRKAARDVSKKWTNCQVYYEIDASLKQRPDDIITIKSAIDEWQKYSCLTFTENNAHKHRIVFQDGRGCLSKLGMQTEAQPLYLARGCRTKGIITHEIGHAIGWYHEHMRPDRDDYIAINFESIPKRYQANYMKYDSSVVDTYGIDYDYTSLMHYGNDALPGSITTLDTNFQTSIGQRTGMSFKDIKLANVMYECATIMKCPNQQCPHGGFLFYKEFKNMKRCQCWCDSGNVEDPLVLCSTINKEPPRPKPQPTTIAPLVNLCYDVREDCPQMKEEGKCTSKMEMMLDTCPKTCGFCGKGAGMCMDHEKGCAIMAAAGMCQDQGLVKIMKNMCPASCNYCESPPDSCELQQELMGHSENGNFQTVSCTLMLFVSLVVSCLLR